MREVIHSVGIDVGTTTTQLLFSRLELENTAAVSSVPRVQIVNREVFYTSSIHFTPLIDRDTIDAERLRVLVEREYATAGIAPGDIAAGAVIITGETARKSNAQSVLASLAGLAGEFVVTAAGSDLESLLAGRGAGTAALSKESGLCLANLDVGGGTTNIAVFQHGSIADSACLDIGGRHILVDPATMVVKAITPQCKRLISSMGLPLRENAPCTLVELRAVTDRFAELMGEMLYAVPRTTDLIPFITNKDFAELPTLQGLTFSGGVAAVMGNNFDGVEASVSWLEYGDIGVLLGHSIRSSLLYHSIAVLPAAETIRATVVGVGVHIVELTGSTVFYSRKSALPLKNIPILKLSPEDEASEDQLSERIRRKIAWFQEANKGQTIGVALRGLSDPSHVAVTELARRIAAGCREMAAETGVLVVLVENDMAKALGNALFNELGAGPDIFSLDAVAVESGDYIDIGKPVAGDRVLPVVVKTLLFGR